MRYWSLTALFLLASSATAFASEKIEPKEIYGQNLNIQCPDNPDKLYNRNQVLKQLIEILNNSVPDYDPKPPGFYITDFGEAGGFFIYDLTDVANNDGVSAKITCIDFIDNHIYHFAPHAEEYSASHILILENGKLKVFKSINCIDSEDNFTEVISYIEEKLKDSKDKDEILFRVKNYRRYGGYIPIDYGTVFYCKNTAPTNDNSYSVDPKDELESNVLLTFANILDRSIPQYRNHFNNGFFRERSKAVGFFVYDLTDPRNKQTSYNELVYFVKNHVYHFAPIDLPWSFSFIAVLGESDIKIFSAINCKGKGDSLNDVIKYLNRKLKNDKDKNGIIKRVRDYRKYGVYASFNGLSSPQCEEVVK